jgi:CRP-like cAMP-binding protein
MHISLPLIKSTEVFGACSSGFTASLSVLMREVTFTTDEVIFRASDVCSNLHIIATNFIKILTVTHSGLEQVRATLPLLSNSDEAILSLEGPFHGDTLYKRSAL